MNSLVTWHSWEKKIKSSKPTYQQKKKSEKQIEQNIQKLWNNIKQSNVYVAGVPEEERQKGL